MACGTLHSADHATVCIACDEANWTIICDKHPKLKLNRTSDCPECKAEQEAEMSSHRGREKDNMPDRSSGTRTHLEAEDKDRGHDAGHKGKKGKSNEPKAKVESPGLLAARGQVADYCPDCQVTRPFMVGLGRVQGLSIHCTECGNVILVEFGTHTRVLPGPPVDLPTLITTTHPELPGKVAKRQALEKN